jgi:anti-anti-sigma factor
METPLLVISGEIDHGNAPVLSAAVEEALEMQAPLLVFDVTDVVYIDSGGVSVLLSTVRRLRERGWSLDGSFRMFANQADALAAIEEFARG